MKTRAIGLITAGLLIAGAIAGCIYIGNIRPVAVILAVPTSGATPLDVDFDATGSTDADGVIAAYLWDFGDGQTPSVTALVTHTYTVQSVSQVFTVILTVTDDLGGTDQATVNIAVSP
ncbi:PKD domain-containing protein [Candidatus Bipolaricaulota bacterium]|nr:PKD domain-containing protein [Candidatus Bipolaricaulota bacterium]